MSPRAEFALPESVHPETREPLVWEDESPWYMAINLTASEVRMIDRAIRGEKQIADKGRHHGWVVLHERWRQSLRIQHIDEFRAGALEPLDPDEIHEEAE